MTSQYIQVRSDGIQGKEGNVEVGSIGIEYPKSNSVLQYKWDIAGFPFPRSLEARKVLRCKWGAYCHTKWGAYCRTNWRCTAVLFRQVVGGWVVLRGAKSRDSFAESLARVIAAIRITSVSWRSFLPLKTRDLVLVEPAFVALQFESRDWRSFV